MKIDNIHFDHELHFLPKKLVFSDFLNIITLPKQGGKSFLIQALIWGLKGHDKKIDKKLFNLEEIKIKLEINSGSNKNKIKITRKIEKNGASYASIKGKNNSWVCDDLRKELGQDILREHFDSIHVFSPLERPIRPSINPIAINYVIGNKDLSLLYARLVQVRRMIGREISFLRKKEGIIIPNEEALLKQLSNLNSKEEALREQMRALRKRLAQLHRIEGAKAIISVLKNRRQILEERRIRLEQKYKKHKEELLESMKKREKQLVTDVSTAENQIIEIERRLSVIKQKVYIYSNIDVDNKEAKCPCCGGNLDKIRFKGEIGKISDVLIELSKEKERLEDQLAAARGFYERSMRLLIQIREEIDSLKALQKELNQINETLKRLRRIARPPKNSGELKKVEAELRAKRNQFAELQKQRGKLTTLLEGTPKEVLKTLNQLLKEEIFVLSLLKIVEESIINTLNPVISQINSFVKNNYIDGYGVYLSEKFTIEFIQNDGKTVPWNIVPYSARALLLLRLKAVLAKYASTLNVLLVDDADRVITQQEIKEYLESLTKEFEIQIIAVTS